MSRKINCNVEIDSAEHVWDEIKEIRISDLRKRELKKTIDYYLHLTDNKTKIRIKACEGAILIERIKE